MRLVGRVQKKFPTNKLDDYSSLLFLSLISIVFSLFKYSYSFYTTSAYGYSRSFLADDLIIVWRIGKGWEGIALSSSRLWLVWRLWDPLSILSEYFYCRGILVAQKFKDKMIYLLKRKSRSIIRTRNFWVTGYIITFSHRFWHFNGYLLQKKYFCF